MSKEVTKRAETIFRQHGGMMATKDAISAGIHPRTLYAMRDEGVLERVSRGRYRLSSMPALSNPDLVTVATRIPRGVICLISALAYHMLTDEIPHQVYIALRPGTEKPRIEHPPVRIVWFSGEAFAEGIEIHEIDGVDVQVYGVAKTIADCFKFRKKIGGDVALEALKTYRNRPDFNLEELMRYARIRKVEKVMRPYLEALL
ncbi:MAG: type IV toxin-antitoxin system AbiEi family antitoxin domain-containing protein [Actinobacteria bacterium]|nr:type IV toxin-antitoxin system AbiEi family antitoxin domain-containing protein [Actinomycetota bacterium]MCG2819537.1 type IV toxin-antitoxin system AbiEi family antitoxin domain-containing protein [Actinomycetes bacterium]MBU4178949.1 type IV toxin-antitoxin system AbiEi family antitoxin domain-containing protein [Actinomycetota bacterium]MBU4218807.1 type IV toxin-antitoxin system AbiEi family antitoxin domain-containing protein [Actinomycetota bacterium]MBU4360225.1 type IV toxin-antitox